LNLNRTQIGDKGIEALADLQSLEWLNLYGTKVTDASVPIIAKYRDLKALYLWNTAVTSNGVSTLRKALPEAKIVRDTDDRAGRFDNLEDPGKFDF